MAAVFVLLMLFLIVCTITGAPRHTNDIRRYHCSKSDAEWLGLNSTGPGASQSLYFNTHTNKDVIIFSPDKYIIGIMILVYPNFQKLNFSSLWPEMQECGYALDPVKPRDIPSITAVWGSLYNKAFQSPLHLKWHPKLQPSFDFNTSVIVTAVKKEEYCKPEDFVCKCFENCTRVKCSWQDLSCSARVNCQVSIHKETEFRCFTDEQIKNTKNTEFSVTATEPLKVTLSSIKGFNLSTAVTLSSVKYNNFSTTEKHTTPLQVTTPTSSVTTAPTTPTNFFTSYSYEPWRYLLFGLFTCCSLLVLFGLLECCRNGTQSSQSSTAQQQQQQGLVAALVIINGAQSEDGELRPRTPRTPGPPRYDDLDQPPSYEFLFPEPTDLIEEER